MPDITLQLYLTDTLTAISGAAVAIWDDPETTVVASGVTSGTGQLTKTLSAGDYVVKTHLDNYTINDTSFTVAAVDFTNIYYGDATPTGAGTFEYYRTQIINNLGGRNDAKTLALILNNFNDVQEFLATTGQFEDLYTSVSTNFVASQLTYTFTELGVTNLNEIIAIRVNNGTSWAEPLDYMSPVDWDIYVATIYPVVEGIPTVYTRRDGKLLFYTTPDDTYDVNIVATLYPTKVTGLASTVDFTRIDGLLINLVTAEVWLALQDPAMAAVYEKKAEKLMSPYMQREIRKRYASSQGLTKIRASLSK